MEYTDEKRYSGEDLKPPPYENDPKEALTTHQHGSTKYQDLWAMILFVLHIALFIALFVFFIRYTDPKSTGSGRPISISERDAILVSLGASLVASLLLTVLYTILLFKFPKAMILGSFIATVGIWIGLGVYFTLKGIVGAGVTFIMFALLETLIVYLWRHRISFSALLLETTVSVISDYPNTITASVVQYIVQIGYFAFWLATLNGLYSASQSKDVSDVFSSIAAVYLFFSLFWTSQVINNVLHVTVAGVFATFYFVVGSGQAVHNPTLSSFRRATTWSFGSVAFGSLIVAIIQTLRFLVQNFRDDNSLAAACVDCMLQCLEQLIAYFNYYAYIQIAIYGKPFIKASKDTWSLIKRAAGDILINDNLIGNVLGISSLACAGICAILSYICCNLMLPSANGPDPSSNVKIAACLLGAAIGWTTMALVGAVVQSGASTTIVCYCEDPEALSRSKHELYQRFVRADVQDFP